MEFLKTLICASEKAACIARSCTRASCKDQLLVAEKVESEANTRFDKDFKTIADVLAQESAKKLIIQEFPEMVDDVRGEECSEIGGISIHLKDSVDETCSMLSVVVPANLAKQIAEAAHRDVNPKCDKLPENVPELNPADLGVWIDPIDGTAEFISGVKGGEDAQDRLLCVTVLIGAYSKSTGQPVVGVINQPFYNNGEGRIFWGIQHGDTFKWSENHENKSNEKIVLLSAAENTDVIEKFKDAGWQVKSVAGAGNKLMKVALGEATAYIVSKGTTFRWDTCAPHSILKSKGGDLLSYKDCTPIKYNDEKNLESSEYCNRDGIIAYTCQSVLDEIKNIIY